MNTLKALAERYVALWNEPDPVCRRMAVATLWAEDAIHRTPSMEARGHAAIEARLLGAYERWVRDNACEFVLIDEANGHHDAVRLRWAMRRKEDGVTLSIGSDLLLIDDTGRIRLDYQFIELN